MTDKSGGGGWFGGGANKGQQSTWRDYRRRMEQAVMQRIAGTDDGYDVNVRNIEREIAIFEDAKKQLSQIRHETTRVFNAQVSAFTAQQGMKHMRENEGAFGSAVYNALMTPASASAFRKCFNTNVIKLEMQMEKLFTQIDELKARRDNCVVNYQHHKRKFDAAEERLATAMGTTKKQDRIEELRQDVLAREKKRDDAVYVLKETTTHLLRKLELAQEAFPLLEVHLAKGVAAAHIAYCEMTLFAFQWSMERFAHANNGSGDDADYMSGGAQTPRPGDNVIREMVRCASGPKNAAQPQFLMDIAQELTADTSVDIAEAAPPPKIATGVMLKPQSEGANGAVFGISLDSMPGADAPEIVTNCIAYLDARALYTKGLFRVPGNNEIIQQMRTDFDEGQEVEFTEPIGVNDVGAIFKLYFRLLPEPLVPHKHFHTFLNATKDERSFPRVIKEAIQGDFKPVNRTVMRLLLAFLSRVERLRTVNMMTNG